MLSSDTFRSSVDLSKINIKVTSISGDVDRSKYVSMTKCITCGTTLGKQGSKKYFCHFCYSAVCAACSPLNVLHPETRKEEKACNPCYIDFLKLIVLETGEEYVKIKLKQEIEEKEQEISKRKILAEELENTKKATANEKSELNKMLNIKEEELKEKDSKIKNFEHENQRIKEFLDEMIKAGKIDKVYDDEIPVVAKETNERSSICMNCSIF